MLESISRTALCLFLLVCPLRAAGAEDPPGATAPATGIARLSYMVGSWDVVSLDSNGKVLYRSTSTIAPILDGRALEETTSAVWRGSEWQVLIVHSYDPFQDTYRSAVLDSDVGLLDIYEGRFDGETLHLSDLGGGTYSQGADGVRFFFRFATVRVSDDRFVIRGEHSADDGHTWVPSGRYEYTRRGAPRAAP